MGQSMKGDGIASVKQCRLSVRDAQDELEAGESALTAFRGRSSLMAQVLSRDNLMRALKQVQRNDGAPGIDGMPVSALPEYLKTHWLGIREQLEGGRYRPSPVLRDRIPGGRTHWMPPLQFYWLI